MIRSLTLALLFLPILTQAALSVTLNAWNEFCGNNNGRIEAVVSGGEPPYAYDWNNGGTTAMLTGLDAGTYTLTLTDNLGTELVESVTITDVPSIQIPDQFWTGLVMNSGEIAVSEAALHPCPGQCNGGFAWSELAMTPTLAQPISYDMVPTETQIFGPIFIGFCAGALPTLQVTDATGCTGIFPIAMINGTGSVPMSLVSVQPACGADGSITFESGNAIGTVRLLDVSYQPTGMFYQIYQGFGQVTFSNVPPGDYYLERVEDLTYYDCPEYLPVTVPAIGPPCGTLSGTLYLDHDQDCSQDVNDEPLSFKVLEVLPGPEYTITDNTGHYELGLAYGNFTVDQQAGTDLLQLCPANDPAPFSIDAGNTEVLINFADSSTVPLDVEAHLHTSQLRPGFEANIWAGALNLSGQLSGAVDFTLTFDPVLSFLSAQPTPTSVVGNTVTWTGLGTLGAFGGASVYVNAQVPPDVGLIGTDLSFTINVSQPLTETSLANNTLVYTRTVTGSYDPNEKSVRTSTGLYDEVFLIEEDEYLEYTIDFQNTGTDTAFTVVVTDTLSAELDMSSFEHIAASHAVDLHFLPDRVVEWRFENILLADSNTNETLSHGFVQFRIRPAEPWLPGTIVANNADIFFDFNPPIRTNDAVVSLETSTAIHDQGEEIVVLFPNPACERIHVQLREGVLKTVEIAGPDGRVWLNERASGSMAEVDLSGLASGNYVLIARQSDGTVLRSPFIHH